MPLLTEYELPPTCLEIFLNDLIKFWQGLRDIKGKLIFPIPKSVSRGMVDDAILSGSVPAIRLWIDNELWSSEIQQFFPKESEILVSAYIYYMGFGHDIHGKPIDIQLYKNRFCNYLLQSLREPDANTVYGLYPRNGGDGKEYIWDWCPQMPVIDHSSVYKKINSSIVIPEENAIQASRMDFTVRVSGRQPQGIYPSVI